ncbi:MAG: magnesium transporter [Desulfobacterales bacterium]|nr:magnesium transporter [Desulfobacterales bacterium]
MQSDRNKILIESIKRLLRRDAAHNLRKILDKTHAADLTLVFRAVSQSNRKQLLDLLDDPEKIGAIFSGLDEDTVLDLMEHIAEDDLVAILEEMPSDDAADLISQLSEEKSDLILEKMKQEDSDEVEDLLHYDEDTAGGIMVPEFIAVSEDSTAKQAIESLQKEHLDVEMPFYLYVVDDYGKLVGVSSLRQLVVVHPNKQLKDFMTTEVVSVRTDMDQEEVAKVVARYDILAVPVVDETNKLMGIVTVDDVIDIFRMEATEDILKMAGAGEEFVETKSIMKSTRIRLPWLFASCVGGLMAFLIIGQFEQSLAQLAYLAAFIPVIMGMGGNIGTQSSTIVVRGLATGRIAITDMWAVVLKELSIGAILGIVYGVLIGFFAHVSYGMGALAFSVSLSVLCSMSVAALVGSLVPMFFARVNIDPAVATGPFVTTAIDIISVYFYFKIATTLLGI